MSLGPSLLWESSAAGKKATLLSSEELQLFSPRYGYNRLISPPQFFFLKVEINNVDVYKVFWKYNHQQPFLFSLTCKLVSTSFLIVL